MYKDALKTLERKFGQSQAVVSAHLDKRSSFPPLKMHNSYNIINYSATISSLVVVFKSLSYDSDLKSASLLNTAVKKLPPNLKVLVTFHSEETLGKANTPRPQRLVEGEGRGK